MNVLLISNYLIHIIAKVYIYIYNAYTFIRHTITHTYVFTYIYTYGLTSMEFYYF